MGRFLRARVVGKGPRTLNYIYLMHYRKGMHQRSLAINATDIVEKTAWYYDAGMGHHEVWEDRLRDMDIVAATGRLDGFHPLEYHFENHG